MESICPNCGSFASGYNHVCVNWNLPVYTNPTAQICPVCRGAGEIPEDYKDDWNRGSSKKLKKCHGCLGRGWVTAQ